MKYSFTTVTATLDTSPPSRGAWIEMADRVFLPENAVVAPLAGGVD